MIEYHHKKIIDHDLSLLFGKKRRSTTSNLEYLFLRYRFFVDVIQYVCEMISVFYSQPILQYFSTNTIVNC